MNSSRAMGAHRGLVAGFVALAVLWGAQSAARGDRSEGLMLVRLALTPGFARCDLRCCVEYCPPTLAPRTRFGVARRYTSSSSPVAPRSVQGQQEYGLGHAGIAESSSRASVSEPYARPRRRRAARMGRAWWRPGTPEHRDHTPYRAGKPVPSLFRRCCGTDGLCSDLREGGCEVCSSAGDEHFGQRPRESSNLIASLCFCYFAVLYATPYNLRCGRYFCAAH